MRGTGTMSRKVVADTSAFMMGPGFHGQDEVHVPPGVERELLGKGLMSSTYEMVVRVTPPSMSSKERVRKAAMETGDDARLSPTDIEVIALALDKGLPIMSDDYSIQNTAVHMGLEVVPVSESGITEERRWTYRCMGCRRTYYENLDECPICGSKVKSGALKRGGRHRR